MWEIILLPLDDEENTTNRQEQPSLLDNAPNYLSKYDTSTARATSELSQNVGNDQNTNRESKDTTTTKSTITKNQTKNAYKGKGIKINIFIGLSIIPSSIRYQKSFENWLK